jgi:hypothetical protein
MKHLRFISLLVALLSVSCIAQYRAEGPVESRSVVLTGTATAIAVSHDVDVVVDATLAQNEAHIMTHSDVIDFVKVYIEDELVLYTNTANEIYLVNDGVATLYEDWESSDKTPFAGGSTVRELYLFHWSPVDMCIDDFKIEIMDYLPASAE